MNDASSQYAPFLAVYDGVAGWADFHSADKEKARYGNLTGLTRDGVALAGYGLFSENTYLTGEAFIGNLSGRHLQATGSGIQLLDGSTTLAELTQGRFAIGHDTPEDGYLEYTTSEGLYIEGSGEFSGTITAGAGEIAGWSIDDDALFKQLTSGDYSGLYAGLSSAGDYAFFAGSVSKTGDDNSHFIVRHDGSGHLAAGGIVWGPDGDVTISGGGVMDWQGSLSDFPENPEDLWAFYHTGHDASYIYNADTASWEVIAQGTDELMAEYSASSSGPWTSTYDPDEHVWARHSTDGGDTWTSPIKIRGEDGDGIPGNYYRPVYRREGDQPATPDHTGSGTPDGWSDAVPDGDEPLWVSFGEYTHDAEATGVWHEPARLTGQDGRSVTWLGEYSSHPTGAEELDAYRNTTDGLIYIYKDGAWKLMVRDGDDGLDGADGSDGLSIFIRYHDNDPDDEPAAPTGDGTSGGWFTDSTKDSNWLSQKRADAADEGTWGDPILIKGHDGEDGEETRMYYMRAYDRPAAPITDDPTGEEWHTTVPDFPEYGGIPIPQTDVEYDREAERITVSISGYAHVPVYMTKARFKDGTRLETWSKPETISGAKGDPGPSSWDAMPDLPERFQEVPEVGREGLHFTNQYLGFWDGDKWPVYISSEGHARFGGTGDSQGFWWDPDENEAVFDGRLVAQKGVLHTLNVERDITLVSGGSYIHNIGRTYRIDRDGIYVRSDGQSEKDKSRAFSIVKDTDDSTDGDPLAYFWSRFDRTFIDSEASLSVRANENLLLQARAGDLDVQAAGNVRLQGDSLRVQTADIRVPYDALPDSDDGSLARGQLYRSGSQLMVSGGDGAEEQIYPTADFTYSTTDDGGVTCSDDSTGNGRSITSRTWRLQEPDGSGWTTIETITGNDTSVVFGPDYEGDYRVELTVSNDQNNDDTVAREMTLAVADEETYPEANFTYNVNDFTNEVHCTDTSNDNGVPITSRTWHLEEWTSGQWNRHDTVTGNETNPTLQAYNGGTFRVELIAQNEDGNSHAVTRSMTIDSDSEVD